MIRNSPAQYFETETPTNTTNYLPYLIFGGICIVAITAMVIFCSKK